MRKELEKALKYTYALDLLAENGSQEGADELYSVIEVFVTNTILNHIKELSDLEQCQSAEDMQYALEDIHNFIKELKKC